MDKYIPYEKKIVAPVPLEYEQKLIFSTTEEQTIERNCKISLTFEREVQVVHTQRIDDLFKFQVFLLDSEYIADRLYESYHELYTRTSYVFDELVLWADSKGNLTSVNNLPFVQYQWAKLREELITEYEGEIVEQHIAFIDELLAHNDLVIQYLSTPSMYGLYFNGCWGKYEHNKFSNNKLSYGRELNNVTIPEKLALQTPLKDSNRFVEIGITKDQEIEGMINYSGNISYLDGILDTATRTIELTNKTIKFSAKWCGLKSYIQ